MLIQKLRLKRGWSQQQLAEAASPNDSLTAEGRQLFESGPCMLCHTVRGTSAIAQAGPIGIWPW